MAWVFSLSAECDSEQVAAEQFAHHFDDVSWVLSNGSHSQCHAEIFQDIEKNWWCRVCPSGISRVGIDTPETAYLMTELGILLYQHLRSAPPFAMPWSVWKLMSLELTANCSKSLTLRLFQG